jgi:glycosyltransferase involved in cell wall biosynthesis
MGKINILHVLQNSNIGGVQQQLLSLLKAYDRDLMNPTVCCFKAKGEIGEQMEKNGIEVVSLNVERHHRFSPRIIRELFRLMKRKEIHVVRTHRYRASFYGRIAALFAHVPVIIPSLHDNYNKELRPERRLVNRMLARISTRIVAVSDSIKQDIIKYDNIDPAKIMIIHNGVDTELFKPGRTSAGIRKEIGLSDKDLVIGFVGRLVPAKGLPHLLEAFAYVRQEYDRAKLLIIGGGQMLGPLRAMALDRGLKDDVFFMGERTDVPQLLSAIDVFVMSSVAEGLPNSLLEAMAAARPVVVTLAGGMGEIIKDGVNGLVVPVGDPASLSQGIKSLLKDRSFAETLGAAARQYIENTYSIRATARAWEDLYVESLRNKGVPVPERTVRLV